MLTLYAKCFICGPREGPGVGNCLFQCAPRWREKTAQYWGKKEEIHGCMPRGMVARRIEPCITIFGEKYLLTIWNMYKKRLQLNLVQVPSPAKKSFRSLMEGYLSYLEHNETKNDLRRPTTHSGNFCPWTEKIMLCVESLSITQLKIHDWLSNTREKETFKCT